MRADNKFEKKLGPRLVSFTPGVTNFTLNNPQTFLSENREHITDLIFLIGIL